MTLMTTPATAATAAAGDTAALLAVTYDWLYPALTKAQRDRIRGALLSNAVLLVRGNYDYHWWANAYRCNWCGICFGGFGVACLALLTENPELVDGIAELLRAAAAYAAGGMKALSDLSKRRHGGAQKLLSQMSG